jgi:hypothetical protein
MLSQAVGWNIVIGFLLSAYTFNLLTELALIPFTTVLVFFVEFLKRKPEYSKVLTVAENLLAIFGFLVVGYAVQQLIAHFVQFATVQNAREFSIPVLLTLMYLPFIYILHLFIAYENAFLRLKYSIKNPIAREYAHRRVAFKFKFDLDGLRKWLRHIGLFEPTTEADVDASFTEIRSVRRREKRPYQVPPIVGWPPDKARTFLSKYQLETGDYHRSHDGWLARSTHLKLSGSFLGNTIAYYIQGSEFSVHNLELILTIFEQSAEETAIAEFSNIASSLVSQALHAFGLADETVSLSPETGPIEIRGKKVELKKEDLLRGYELKLLISATDVPTTSANW